MKEFFEWLSSGSISVIVFLASIAIIAIAITVAITYAISFYRTAFLQGREIFFWPPKIGKKPIEKDAAPLPEIKQVSPTLEPHTTQQLARCGLTHAFRIPTDNTIRLKRVQELIEHEANGNRKLRLAASSGFSYINPNGPVWADAGLGELITSGTIKIDVVLESPFSHFALTRALANGVEHHHWEEKQMPENLINLLQYPNVTVRVTEMSVNCSLFLTSQAIFYDPYLWGLLNQIARTENKFWVLEFAKVNGRGGDCYDLLEKHFKFLSSYSIPLEEVLHEPKVGSQVPLGLDFFTFSMNAPEGLAINRYETLTKEFKQNVRKLKERKS